MKSPAILETVLARWSALNPRERKLVTWGFALVGLAVTYFVFFEPAWQGRERLRGELPELRQQVGRLEALSKEASTLTNVRSSNKAQAVVRSELQRSLTAAGLGDQATVDAGNDIIKVKLDQVSMDNTLTWLYGATRDIKLRVVDVKIVRDVARGRVVVTLSLERPGAKG